MRARRKKAGTGGGTRTHKTKRSADFESAASASSATPAESSILAYSPT